ncbi:unnamed protein product [Penicillium nalgiovense]|uniref:DUF7907 domain-containing protein n=3 Tax=Penicillium TaxID=5073 RepID=A0A1V6WNT6_PENNA|nr:hypothetical protein PENNAL_c0223G11303 [Penicillium nalgiovense]CAG7959116.1 unnamed protein product [Penicillium salamii]CAG7968487.1 unnamed protein product [Penicillium salamii]CAG8090522.1 unnamed protein product [Penicillium nalgiovense]CAG8130844.1 unnamed protein product [Penicillium nalgiovense]
MKTLTSLLMLAASAIVTPVASTSSPEHFHIKSVGATNQEHNNLYVYAYHTGAGPNDAVLAKDVNTASSVYLDGTGTFFDFNTKLLWGVVATGDNKFTSWGPNLINAGQGSNGFSVKGNSFMWSEASGFGGWLVCDWYHKAPQLFYLNRYYDATIPSSCSKIQLKTEYIN